MSTDRELEKRINLDREALKESLAFGEGLLKENAELRAKVALADKALTECFFLKDLQATRAERAESKVQRLRGALEKLLTHSIEFYNDWTKGDFELPKLAQCDMRSMAEQFPAAGEALSETEAK